ncbi:MAG: hypothetical protein K9H14_04680 [Actinomycetia bacterium]|nr:hypothetical protein [Actinomycetes bacterium]
MKAEHGIKNYSGLAIKAMGAGILSIFSLVSGVPFGIIAIVCGSIDCGKTTSSFYILWLS